MEENLEENFGGIYGRKISKTFSSKISSKISSITFLQKFPPVENGRNSKTLEEILEEKLLGGGGPHLKFTPKF
jgi:hypothetical protein